MLPVKAFQGEEHRPFTLSGGRPLAVLVHGFPGTPDEMRPLAHALHRAGWTVHVPLLPGFGADIESLPDRKLEDWRQAVIAAVIERQSHHAPVMLVGHSLGGALSIIAASQQPVDGLILLAPFYRIPHPLWTALPVLRIAFPQVKPFRLINLNFDDPETRAGIHNFMPDADLNDPQTQAAIKAFAIPVAMINQIRRAGMQAYRVAPQMRLPTLVIQGRQDELVRPTLTRRLIQRFDTHAGLLEVDGEHDLIRADRPAWHQIQSAVLDFAATLTSKRPTLDARGHHAPLSV